MGKRITQKQINEFANEIAVQKPNTISGNKNMSWYSKVDGSCLTIVGDKDWMNDIFKLLLKFGVTEQIQATPPQTEEDKKETRSASLGFNPIEKKWYGWSHRAIFGFGIGSTCKKGDCGYRPMNKQDFIESCVRFWNNENHLNVRGKESRQQEYVDGPKELGILVEWEYDNTIPNKKLRGTTRNSFQPYPKQWGIGEWEAKTLDDAKQMAIDFANGVS